MNIPDPSSAHEPPAARFRPVRSLSIVAAVGAIALALVAGRHGSGLPQDSASYIAAARSIARGEGVRLYDGRPMTLWPPLYPALMALVERVTGSDPVTSAPVLGGVMFGVVIAFSGWLFTRALGATAGIALAGAAAALTSRALVSQFLQAESGPLFVTLALLCLIMLDRHMDTGSRSTAALAAFAAAAATLAHYTGVVLVALGVVAVLFGPRAPWRTRLGTAAAYATVSLLPLLLWALRNERVGGAPFGPRAPAVVTLDAGVQQATRIVAAWFLPLGRLPDAIEVTVAAAALVALCALGLTEMRRRRPGSHAGPLLLGYAAGYAAFVVAASLTIAVDRLNTRLLMPAFPALVALFVAGLLAIARIVRRAPAWLPVALVGLWLAWSARQASLSVRDYTRSGGWGYAARRWKRSPVIRALRTDPALAGAFVYSNAPGAVYLLADRPAWDSPEKTMYGSHLSFQTPAELRAHWPQRVPALLAWFDDVNEPSDYRVAELADLAILEPVARLEDGTIYRARRMP